MRVVPEYDASNGHELCTAQPWMQGLLLDAFDKSWLQQSLHPSALGHRAFARNNPLKVGVQL